jgi:hypothetical protein
MCFYRPLGNVQLPGDFRVVAALKEEIDDLPLSWPDLVELLFHDSTGPALNLAPALRVGVSRRPKNR